ncbi:efflux RND transporter periplasmic adaptor subunit [Methylobacterium planeticum]|nr:HlyD family efflux transporter periplasmic adaptor subunit [Methylobacterium planeticum]
MTAPAFARGDTVESVIARGRIEPQGGVIAVSGPPESLSTVAIIDRLLVEPGTKVTPGQMLAILNGYDLARADFEVATANLQVARLQRSQVQAGAGKKAEVAAQTNVLAARRAQLVRAEKEWSRATTLVQRNVGSIQTLDIQKANFDQLTQEVEQAQNALKALTEVRSVDDELAAGQVAVAEANVARAQAAMERLQIRARSAGTILSIQTRSGEVVASEGILRLGDLDRLIVVAEVDQGQVRRLHPGMQASIEGPQFPTPIAGTVTRVANEIHRQKRSSSDILVGRDARIVEVDVTPLQPLLPIIGAEVTVRLSAAQGER